MEINVGLLGVEGDIARDDGHFIETIGLPKLFELRSNLCTAHGSAIHYNKGGKAFATLGKYPPPASKIRAKGTIIFTGRGIYLTILVGL